MGPPGIPSHRWEDSTEMDLKEICCEFLDWIYLTQDSDQCLVLGNRVMELRVS